ncbi:MAG TPA: hypothetical protein VM680_12650 [Verrucomicrobiae bacterium]|nr:hypothetical protein [Verrucomicrobiae bacterium]
MTQLTKGKTEPLTQDKLLELMQRLRDAWFERRMRRIEVIQDLHC